MNDCAHVLRGFWFVLAAGLKLLPFFNVRNTLKTGENRRDFVIKAKSGWGSENNACGMEAYSR